MSTDAIPITEAAQHYGCSTRSVYRLVSKGLLTVHRRPADRRLYVSRSEIERIRWPQPQQQPATAT